MWYNNACAYTHIVPTTLFGSMVIYLKVSPYMSYYVSFPVVYTIGKLLFSFEKLIWHGIMIISDMAAIP